MFWRKKAVSAYQIPTFARDDTAGQLKALHEDGFALIPGVLSDEQIEAARVAIDRLTPFHWDYTGPTDHYKCVFNRDPFWLPLLDPPGVIELAEAALGADCHVIGQTAWRSHPGHRGVGLHADYLVVQFPEEWLQDPRFTLPMQICTAHVYLSDITEDLCPTYVIPGSHKAGRQPKPTEYGWKGRVPEVVLCKAGDVLFFRSELWHSGSDNTTADRVRYLLQIHYGRRMVAQKFSPYLSWQFNPEVLAQSSPRQRRLLGDHRPGAYD
ncbi:MAG: phytanoyl-CoA dioxygenase family protein [Gemmataceae bacterium]|nr:phytanoyl-CoA dioxygenase family protein [Gemmataceae bacterium]